MSAPRPLRARGAQGAAGATCVRVTHKTHGWARREAAPPGLSPCARPRSASRQVGRETGRGRGTSHPELCPGNVPGARLGAPSGAVVRAAGAPDRGHPFLCATCPAGAAAPWSWGNLPPAVLPAPSSDPDRSRTREGLGPEEDAEIAGPPQRLPRWQVKTPVPHPPRAGVS